jgi:LysR family carnitine catabolism transcriptional activator
MNLTIRQLEALAAAARARSFSAAAQTLGVSQPALSGMIKKIEEEVGLRLFERTTRSLALTADGRHVAAIAEEVVRDFRTAVDSISARSIGRRGRLSLAVLPSIACSTLPDAISRFHVRFPGIEIAVHDVLHERAEAMVLDGLADLAVTIRPSRRDELYFQEIADDELHLVCRRDDKLAKERGALKWSALEGRPFVGLARNSSVRRMTDSALVDGHPAVQAIYEVEQIPSAIALVRAGLGVTALPTLTFAMFAMEGLTTRPLIAPVVRRRIGSVTLKNRVLSQPTRLLLAELADGFKPGGSETRKR